ncbi:MAG: nucleotidyltransferase domain-containing protein, partial [Pseudomonadota bacterium]
MATATAPAPAAQATSAPAVLDEALASARTAPDPRAAALAALAAALETGRQRALAGLGPSRDVGPAVARDLSAATDLVVRGALDWAFAEARPAKAAAPGVAAMAVGGYGRGEMAPFSDVDLLFLTPARRPAWVDKAVEGTLYLLWDLKLKVGHSVRTVAECLRLAR